MTVHRNGPGAPVEQEPSLILADAMPPEYSDDALAQEFARRHEDELRYTAPWHKWMIWDGARWKIDETIAAFDLARGVCRVAADQAETEPKRVALCSAKTVAAVEKMAKADRRIAATPEQWDSNPDIFTTEWNAHDD